MSRVPIHDKFTSWWQLHALRTGQPDTKFHTPKEQKRKQTATYYINGESGQWCSSGTLLKLVFAYCTYEHLDKVQDV